MAIDVNGRTINSTNYDHPTEPNLNDLHKTMEYNALGQPVLRTTLKVGQTDAMATIHKADLGYCNFLHFKCAGDRSCTAWVTGGAIDNKDRTQ